MASSCFPIFKPQAINGEEYYDGGFYDNVPINMLIEQGYENIIVADICSVCNSDDFFSYRVAKKQQSEKYGLMATITMMWKRKKQIKKIPKSIEKCKKMV